jgi:hypothetical protein
MLEENLTFPSQFMPAKPNNKDAVCLVAFVSVVQIPNCLQMGKKIPLAEVLGEILSSMELNFPCLDRDNLVSFVFFSIEIDYLWHRRIGFVCQ